MAHHQGLSPYHTHADLLQKVRNPLHPLEREHELTRPLSHTHPPSNDPPRRPCARTSQYMELPQGGKIQAVRRHYSSSSARSDRGPRRPTRLGRD